MRFKVYPNPIESFSMRLCNLLFSVFVMVSGTALAGSECVDVYSPYSTYINESLSKISSPNGQLKIVTTMLETEIQDGFGQRLATMSYHIESRSEASPMKTLWVDYMYVKPSSKKQGLTKILLAAVLAKNGAVERVGGQLSGTNKQVYGNPATETQRRVAVKNTPFYKMVSYFGFSQIDADRISIESFYLKRPSK